MSGDEADMSPTTSAGVNKVFRETLLAEGSGENMADNVDDISPFTPSWVNKQFIETVLNKASEGTMLNKANEGTMQKVESFEAKYACEEGMSYSSYILKIVATVRLGESATCEKRSFILKYSEVDGETEDELVESETHQFQPEPLVLAKIMPQVHRLLRGVEGEDSQPVSPRCYLSASSPAPLLAIEDLSPAGFRTADGPTPLTYQHCAAIVRAYARLHAASAKLLKDQPHYKALLDPKDSMTDGCWQYYRDYSDHLFKAVARMLRAQQGYENYAAKYERLAEKFTNGFFKYWWSGDVRLPVVLHGDCWKYNYMFTYENENVTGVRLIDFQGSLVHSGAADLVHFLYRNAGVEVHRDHVAPLLADYHGTLVALLRQLGMAEEADNYPLQALLDDVDAAGANALYYSALSLMSLTSHERSAHWGEFFGIAEGSEELLEDAFRNPHYVACLKYLVTVFDKKGLL